MRTLELYKYNPDQMSATELETTFTFRKNIIQNILADLRAGFQAKVNQHFLITGPRGIGKTNLLLMIRHLLETDRTMSVKYLPLKTAEEEYAITSLRDFLVRIVELLEEKVKDPEIERESEVVASMINDEQAVAACIAVLKKYYSRTNQKIIIFMDNIDLILDEQMTDKAQLGRLRDLLMNEAFMVLVGAAPTFFKEVSGYDRPFYNFFKLITLEDLPLEGLLELLKKRAEWDDNQEMLNRLEEIHPRLEAVYHLTGGNPRLALILYQLYTQTALPEVRTTLQMLLDDMTPYYKHRMEKLAPQQRKVMDAFARMGRPTTPTDLSHETRIKVNQITSILNRLKEDGFVAVAPQERRKSTLYIVSERVFRLWHQMRFSNSGRRKLEFFIEFIKFWYSASEWGEETLRLRGAYLEAMQEKRREDSYRFLEHLDLMIEAAPRTEMAYEVEDDTIRTCIESGDCDSALKLLKERLEKYDREGNRPRIAQTWFLLANLYYSQDNRDDEIAALKKVISDQPDSDRAFAAWGNALSYLARRKPGKEQEALFREAFEKYGKAVKIKADFHEAFYNWGNALSYLARRKTVKKQTKLLEQASKKAEEAIRLAHKFEDYEREASYLVLVVKIALLRCANSLHADNRGEARKFFKSALDVIPKAETELVNWEIFRFFQKIVKEKNVEMCAELLNMLRNRNCLNQFDLLEPYKIALEYWQKGREQEVLDRLNPEIRQIVELVVKEGNRG